MHSLETVVGFYFEIMNLWLKSMHIKFQNLLVVEVAPEQQRWQQNFSTVTFLKSLQVISVKEALSTHECPIYGFYKWQIDLVKYETLF